MDVNIIHLSEVDSTNKYIKDRHDELSNFSFVYADYQTNGRGRKDHAWESDRNMNLLCSILIKDPEIIANFKYISLYMGLIIKDMLKLLDIKHVSVKWPNDVYVNDKKIAGILLEGSLPDYMVIGIGINTNQKVFIADNCTSISKETKKEVSIVDFANYFYHYLTTKFKKINPNQIIRKYKRSNYLKNKNVSFDINGQRTEGIVKGIDKQGSIIIKSDEKTYHLSSDEVNLIK